MAVDKVSMPLVIFLNLLFVSVLSFANTVRITLPTAKDENPWFYVEKPCSKGQAGCSFAFDYYDVKKRIRYTQPNKTVLSVWPYYRIKVSRIIDQPGGKVIVRFRTPYGKGCTYSSCTLVANRGDLVKIPPNQLAGALLQRPNPPPPPPSKPILGPYGSGQQPYSLYQSFAEAYRKAGNPNQRLCPNCAMKPVAPLPKSPASNGPIPNSSLDKTIAWLGNYLKCDNFKYLKTQRENLARAEREFKIPARVLACEIAIESRWDIGADQTFGPFKGLPQADKPALNTVKAYIDDDNERIFNEERRARWDRFTKNALGRTKPLPISSLGTSGIYRDGGRATAEERNKIGVVSIAFMAMYLKEIMNGFEDHVESSRGAPALANFRNLRLNRYLAAAIGYNAGPAYADNIMPAAGYTTDNLSWIPKINPPPYVNNAKAMIRRACFSPPAKGQKPIPTAKRKFGKGTPCTAQNISKYLANQNQRAAKKRLEVEQYIKWIGVCAQGDQAVHPPNRGLKSNEQFYGGRCKK